MGEFSNLHDTYLSLKKQQKMYNQIKWLAN